MKVSDNCAVGYRVEGQFRETTAGGKIARDFVLQMLTLSVVLAYGS